ncbi:MAG: bifunctional 5,6,7,8-tetrahydromethanopterin hydro-lyase/3-hexulose-6-phosphate synthase [Candidatus Methanofastidiosia archaeon]
MYEIGEALIGSGNEVAHVDLLIGTKDSPVGIAFATGLSQLSFGHTPLLGVIRPNLLAKPAVLIVPKVTVKGLKDASKIFGPAQTAVARAVVDSVEEGLFEEDELDEIVIIASVFVHPKAKDFRKIYQYNYGATRLAIRRALKGYPPIKKILKEKDRGKHPIMGFRVQRLWNPPYLQVALDMDSLERVEKVVKELPRRERILIEAGTPLIKKFGVDVVQKIRELRRDAFLVADLKTLDVSRIEVKIASDSTSDAVCISGLSTKESINKAIHEAKKQGIYSYLDMMNVGKPIEVLNSLKFMPDVILMHRNVDYEASKREAGEEIETMWGNLSEIRGKSKALVAVAGGITPQNTKEALESGADIIVVGRYIYQSGDPRRASEDFLAHMPPDADTMRLMLDEDEEV